MSSRPWQPVLRRRWLSDLRPGDLWCLISHSAKGKKGVKEKGKSPKCKTCYQMPSFVPTTKPARVGCRIVPQKDFQAPPPGVSRSRQGRGG